MSETPSAAELRARVSAVLETANLDELTVKKLVGQLSTEFGNDLSARKSEVKQLVDELLPKAVEHRRKLENGNKKKPSNDNNDNDDNDDDNESTQAKPKKAAAKKKSTGGKYPSLELRAVIGETETAVTFFSVIKLLWVYIKEHNLKSGKNVICDDKLRAVFGRDEVGSFQMSKFLGQHLLPEPNQSVGTIVQPDLTPKPKADKPAKATKRKKKEPSADKPPRVVPESSKRFVSTQVAAVIGRERSTMFELTKLFWAYIKEHQLQSPESKTVIVCDDKLKAVFGVDRIGSFTMAKYFKQHLMEKDAEGPRTITVVQPPPSVPKERGQTKKKAKVSKSSRPDADSDEDDDGNVDDVVESEGEAADDDDEEEEEEEEDDEDDE